MSFVARGGSLNLAGAVVSGVLTFLFYVLVARGLGKADVGAFFVATAVFTIVATSFQLGAHVGFVRFIPQHRVHDRGGDVLPMLAIGLVPVVALGAVAGMGMFFAAGWLAHVVSAGPAEDLVRRDLRAFSPFVPVLSAFTVVVAALQGMGSMRPSVTVDKLGRTGLQVLAGGVALAIGGSLAFVAAWAAPYLIGLVAGSLWLLRLVSRLGATAGRPLTRPASLAREFWKFSGPRGVASVFQVLVLWLDTVLIAALSTTEQAGTYAVATRYLVVGTLAVGALLQVFAPKVSELFARGEMAALSSVYQGSVAWLMALVWPVYVTIAVFSPTLLLLFGHRYTSASGVLALLAAAMLFATACGPVDVVLLMAGRSWYSLCNWGLALSVNVGIDVWLIPRHGMMGAAIGWSASILARNFAALIEVWVLLRLHPVGPGFRRVVTFSLLCFGVLGGLIRLTLGTGPAAFLVASIVGSVGYALLLHRARATLKLDLLFATLGTRLRRRPSGGRHRGPRRPRRHHLQREPVRPTPSPRFDRTAPQARAEALNGSSGVPLPAESVSGPVP